MGTNYYTLKGKHIGKRSAAGSYCWDCKISLCKEGEENVHSSYGYVARNNGKSVIESLDDYLNYIGKFWYDECPRCNKKITENPTELKGVTQCCSFSWDIHSEELGKIRYVKNEYGDRYTIKEFKKMLEGCPIQFYDSIGKNFS